MPHFPIRAVCIVVGLAPFIVTHPVVQQTIPIFLLAVHRAMPVLVPTLRTYRNRAVFVLGLRTVDAHVKPDEKVADEAAAQPLSMMLQRIMDDDRLSDECWNAEMREVQLWENERFGGAFLRHGIINNLSHLYTLVCRSPAH